MDVQDSNLINTRQTVSLDSLPVIRERVSVVDQMRAESAAAAPPPAEIPPAPAELPPAPDLTPPSPQPASDAAPPIRPQDSPRVQDRINKLWAQKRTAEEESASLRAALAEQNAKIDQLMQLSLPRLTQQNSPSPFQAPDPSLPPAGQFVTRQEFEQIRAAERQAFMAEAALRDAHISSRLEAERDFPDVTQNPAVRATADQIWQADPALQRDPSGPYKAFILARGLHAGSQPAPASPSADARKQGMSFGPSVPTGGGQPSREQRYAQALARARVTQDLNDFALARKIQLGLG